MTTRRVFMQTAGALLAGLALPLRWPPSAPWSTVTEIPMRSYTAGSKVWFHPIGVLADPGATIRWVANENVHTTTAYHPTNDHHPLRIPQGAEPWNSGYLVN